MKSRSSVIKMHINLVNLENVGLVWLGGMRTIVKQWLGCSLQHNSKTLNAASEGQRCLMVEKRREQLDTLSGRRMDPSSCWCSMAAAWSNSPSTRQKVRRSEGWIECFRVPPSSRKNTKIHILSFENEQKH